MTKRKNELEITRWEQPNGARFSSKYGWVSFSEWVRCEAESLARAGIQTEIATNDHGEICLRRKEAPCNAM